ncbi:MAG: hypothetical protein V2A58_16225 [Planctomycetota bacterium]
MKTCFLSLLLVSLLLAPLAFAQEKTVADLEKELRATRNKGDWPVVAQLADELIARPDASQAFKSEAKVYRWTALARTLTDFAAITAAAKEVEDDPDMTAFWKMQVYLEQAQTYPSRKEYELAIEKADKGIELVRKMMETQPKASLADRIWLMAFAKCESLVGLGETDEAAAYAAKILEEADNDKIPMRMSFPADFLARVARSDDQDLVYASAARATRAVSRTGKPAEVSAFLSRLPSLKLENLEDAKDALRDDLAKALMGIPAALKDAEDADAAKTASDAAAALAEKF